MYSVGSRPSDKGGVPGHHPDPEIEGDGGLKKNIFLALRASFWSKNKRGGASRPWIRHCCTGFVAKSRTTLYFLQQDFATYNNLTFFCKAGTTWQFNSFRRRLSKSPVIFVSWLVILRNLIQARFARFWELMRGWLVASLVLQQLHVSAPPFQRTLSHS